MCARRQCLAALWECGGRGPGHRGHCAEPWQMKQGAAESAPATQAPSPSALFSFLHFPSEGRVGDGSPAKAPAYQPPFWGQLPRAPALPSSAGVGRDLGFLRQHRETYIRSGKMKRYSLVFISTTHFFTKLLSLQCLLCSKH